MKFELVLLFGGSQEKGASIFLYIEQFLSTTDLFCPNPAAICDKLYHIGNIPSLAFFFLVELSESFCPMKALYII
jgi:hypothetical protein